MNEKEDSGLALVIIIKRILSIDVILMPVLFVLFSPLPLGDVSPSRHGSQSGGDGTESKVLFQKQLRDAVPNKTSNN